MLEEAEPEAEADADTDPLRVAESVEVVVAGIGYDGMITTT